MFLGLDKLINQGIRKVIVAVPEMSIGSSFRDTALTQHGFFADWTVEPENNLCIGGGEKGKVAAFRRFMHGDSQILVCTHATLRFAFDSLDVAVFDHCLVAIDEFHHVSADENSRLGALLDALMKLPHAHIIAMTGSYFRGDTVPILLPDDEAQFTKVSYSYYEQLNGYEYLKSLGIGYHFYQGRYINALPSVLDPTKKPSSISLTSIPASPPKISTRRLMQYWMHWVTWSLKIRYPAYIGLNVKEMASF